MRNSKNESNNAGRSKDRPVQNPASQEAGYSLPRELRAAAGGRRRRRSARLLGLLGGCGEMNKAGGADLVHHADHDAIMSAAVGLHEHGLVQAADELVADLPGDLFLLDLFLA